ncbi:hypothetical protein [Methylobacterium iners]|uniref:Uncharacterized protein n=1 Tax=Methylobacterium iners TaxID=418707 RepID=A0ABQ4RXJ4_9HYPH|nr:hypothetical protein [Methylobacterium iners]GJD95296.1 hypothetical protein OCOJLMKI_2507 [Methylobacterium iners]
MIRGLFLAALLVAPAGAESLGTDSDCGGDAFSSAQVIEGRPPRRGPITSVPDTLCADLSTPKSNTRIEIYGLPGGVDGRSGAEDRLGAEGAAAPYEGERRGARRSGPRRRDD